MKKFILFLLTFVLAVVGVSCAVTPTAQPEENEEVTIRTLVAASSSSSDEGHSIPITAKDLKESLPLEPPPSSDVEEESIEGTPVEQVDYNDDIPLSYEEQEWLQAACKEFEVPYALALGLIEKETNFRNVVGDDGASTGYMQIQQKWHWDRMERLGVTNLLDPEGNFRVGLDFLSELYGRYDDWGTALTVYNMGYNPGYVTNYAYAVMDNYERWQETTQNFG